MAISSAYEIYMIELMNRARLDPDAESQRLGIGLNDNLSPGTITADPKQPLAPNALLTDAARDHSQWMLDNDTFSHTGANGSTPQDRIQAAGYQLVTPWSVGENLGWQGTTAASFDTTQYVYDIYTNLFNSAGHRQNMLDGTFREIGVGALTGDYQGYNSLMVTQNFASSGTDIFVTGVSYNDTNGDGIFTPGEERANTSFDFQDRTNYTSITNPPSGFYYSAKFAPNSISDLRVTFDSNKQISISLGSENIKVDYVNGNEIRVSTSATLRSADNGDALRLLGMKDLDANSSSTSNVALHGNKGKNHLQGYDGNDTLYGHEGSDILEGRAGDDVFHGGSGADIFYYDLLSAADLGVDTIQDWSYSDGDIILIENGSDQYNYYKVQVSASGTTVNINYDNGIVELQLPNVGTDPVVVATKDNWTSYADLKNGSRANMDVTWFDWAGTRPYMKYTQLYDGNGDLVRQFGDYDNGNRWDFYWDVNNTQPWQHRYDYYNSNNQMYEQQGKYDNNESWIQIFDADNTRHYSSYITYYDTQNRPKQQQSFYDNGGKGITTWDPDGTQAFSEYTTYYDAQGRADTQNGIYDQPPQAGVARWWTDFDQEDVKNWQTYTVWYDSNDNIVKQWLVMDDGSIVYL